jgi:hypothetical protein
MRRNTRWDLKMEMIVTPRGSLGGFPVIVDDGFVTQVPLGHAGLMSLTLRGLELVLKKRKWKIEPARERE